MRYFIELSYNGKAYHGWQNQLDVISVQEVVENALSTLLRVKTPIVGAGRTDAGVHAKQIFAHFDVEAELVIPKFQYNLNSFLPKDIAINSICKVKNDAHARFDALSRSYLYRFSLKKNVFNTNYAYFFKTKLNLEAIKAATQILFEYNDFQCFSKVNTDVKTYNCSIKDAYWTMVDDELHFTITADRFLRNMVRAIVGTLINVGMGKMPAEEMHAIIKSKNRSEAGFSVPAHALYLIKVEYPKSIYLHE